MTLRVVVDFHRDETRLSLVSRLAIANGYSSLSQFLALTATSAQAISFGDPKAIAMISDWSGVEPGRLATYDIKGAGLGATWKLGPALMSKDMRVGNNHRYCPKCVLADLENGLGRPSTRPYVRATWMTRAVNSCVVHECSIVEAPAGKFGQGDFSQFVTENIASVRKEATAASNVGTRKIDEYVGARVAGEQTNPFLDGLETYVAVDLCRHIGRFEQEHHPENRPQSSDSDLIDVETGFAIASLGAGGIETVVAKAATRALPPAVEIKSFFGTLCPWLRRNGSKEEFATLTELFQGIAERHLPIGKDDLFILPTRRRYLHSVRSASIEYKIMEDRVYQLVIEAELVHPSELSSSRVYFDAEKGHQLLSDALDTMTSSELAAALGLNIDRTRAFLEADLIPRVELSDGARPYSRVRRIDFEAFRDKLKATAASAQELERLKDINGAARTAYCKSLDIVALALGGKLQSLRRIHADGVISGLAVDPDEVLQKVSSGRRDTVSKNGEKLFDSDVADPSLLNRRQAERRLKTASGTVRELVHLGYLKEIEACNRRTHRRQNYVCARSLAAFDSVHVSLAILADKAELFPGVLRRKLDTNGIKSIFEPTGRNSRYYRIADVRDLIG